MFAGTAGHKIRVFSVLSVLLALDKTFEVFQKSNVLLVLQGCAELHQLVRKSVVHPPVRKEIHEVVIQGLRGDTPAKGRMTSPVTPD